MTANTVFAAGSLVGAPVRRVEDPDLLTGRATYIDNLQVDGMLELAFVRSTVAHANLVSIDTSEARGMPGVVGVYTASDIDVPEYFLFMKINPAVTRPSLAQDRVRFVGDIIAVVVADTRAQAVDAAEAVIVDYDPLPAVTDLDDALAPDAPLLFEELGSNVCGGNRGNPGDPLEDAEVVVRGRFVNQRVAVVPMEGAAVAVVPGDDGFGNDVVMHLACQMPHMTKMLAAGTIGVDMDKLRVIAPHVGGSFGAKHFSAEALVAARLARELNRPVRWVESRSENMIGMTHGRSQVQYVELGLKRDGTITGMRCRVIGDARRVRRFRWHARDGLDANDGARRVPHPEDRLRRRRRAHQRHTSRRVPGCGASGGGLSGRAHSRHGRRRARHGPDRAAAQEPDPARRIPLRHRHRRYLRHWRLRRTRCAKRSESPSTTLSSPIRRHAASAAT